MVSICFDACSLAEVTALGPYFSRPRWAKMAWATRLVAPLKSWIGGSMERLKETTSCVRENSMAALGDAVEAWNKRMQQVFSVPRSFCGGSELRKISANPSPVHESKSMCGDSPHPSMASFLNSSASAQAAMLRRGSQSSIDLAKEAQVVVCGVYPPQRERTQLTYATKGERMENHRLKVVPAPKWDIIC